MSDSADVSTGDVEVTLRYILPENLVGEEDSEEGENSVEYVFDVHNLRDEPISWDNDNLVYVGDDDFQYPDTMEYGDNPSEPFEEDLVWNSSTDIMPQATARCVSKAELPDDIQLSRVVYDGEDVTFELTISDEIVDRATVSEEEYEQWTPDTPSTNDVREQSADDDGEPHKTTSKDFEVELKHIVEDAGGTNDITLLAFEIRNQSAEKLTWKSHYNTFVDDEGYQHSEYDALDSGIISSGIETPGWETRSNIHPGARSKCIVDVNPQDGNIESIHYDDITDNEYSLYLPEETRESLSISYEEFLEEHCEEEEEEESEDVDERISEMVVETSPSTTYEDIGGLEEQKRQVRETVKMPLEEPEAFEELGISPPSGVLLVGPPGTGKTMLARAVANDTDATFVRLAGSELARPYVGEGAELVRECFDYARENAPTVLFVDEIDAIAAQRNQNASGGTEGIYRTLAQLLVEMDGFEEDSDVRILAATNRIDRLDNAILRPGRFDRIVNVPLPGTPGREKILETLTEDMALMDDVEFEKIARRADDMSGAELNAVCTEAGYQALRAERAEIAESDFLSAVETVSETQSAKDAETNI